nr:DUF1349 domain-containing protein [uncultured Treponema sp.]
MKVEATKWAWTREPKDFKITDEKIEIITTPHTDLWQRTYYHFRNDNSPMTIALNVRKTELNTNR